VCSTECLVGVEGLVKIGVPSQDGASLTKDMNTEESKVPSQPVAMFSRFEGIMMMDSSAAHQYALDDQAAGH
jgi:hypothetical protein